MTTAYAMDADWRFAGDGQPENRLQGHMTETETGYLVEFRIPLSMLGSRRSFGLSVVDVDNAETREIGTIAQTLPTSGPASFNLVVLRSPEVLNIIRGLTYSGARILVVDPQQRVRAESGSFSSQPSATPSGDWADALLDPLRPLVRGLVASSRSDVDIRQGALVGEEVIRNSLGGEPTAVLRRLANGEEIIMATHPIVEAIRTSSAPWWWSRTPTTSWNCSARPWSESSSAPSSACLRSSSCCSPFQYDSRGAFGALGQKRRIRSINTGV